MARIDEARPLARALGTRSTIPGTVGGPHRRFDHKSAMSITCFSFPTTVCTTVCFGAGSGAGVRALAGPHLVERGRRRPLIVADAGLVAPPLIAELKAALESAGLIVSVYRGLLGNSTGAQVMNGAAAYEAHESDCVVGVGGGAALEVAKVVGPIATHSGDVMRSTMGAVACQKDLGAVHASAHALGTVCDLHLGLANAPMLEPVVAFNTEAVPQRFAELAHAAGVTAASGFVPWLANLTHQIGIALGLASVGVKREQLGRLAVVAMGDSCDATDPRVCTPADFERFFDEAF